MRALPRFPVRLPPHWRCVSDLFKSMLHANETLNVLQKLLNVYNSSVLAPWWMHTKVSMYYMSYCIIRQEPACSIFCKKHSASTACHDFFAVPGVDALIYNILSQRYAAIGREIRSRADKIRFFHCESFLLVGVVYRCR
jgi:hypothetical protein